ncbi:MAG TPA: DUF1080 domain-containing protein [Phycisphaerae bacterium]|nr:DUF1080 domain-containing protein [Phycisphaerae bacterium]
MQKRIDWMRLPVLFLASIVLVLLGGCNSQSTSSGASATNAPVEAQMQVQPEFVSLFDGKTLNGWIQIPENSWTVKDGAIASLGVGRGMIYTTDDYSFYRLIFTARHITVPKHDHQECFLIFCTRPTPGQKPLDALGGVQFQIPNGGHWDYRKGHNNGGKGEFTTLPHPKFDPTKWFQVEILVNAATGKARMAVAQPVGSKAVEVLDFDVPAAGKTGPFAFQMHNKGLFDEYKDVMIEVNPTYDGLITTK